MQKNKKGKVHLIGIAGAGMSALAVMLKKKGYTVSGSDEDVYEPIPSYLRKNKVSFKTKHNKKNLPADADLVIVGNHAGLAPEENPETREAVRLGLEIKSLPQVLGEISKDKENIVIAGSFGKSTMTSLVAFILKYAGKKPSYFIGAVPIDLEYSGEWSSGKEFILEGDEYTTSYFDSGSKFLHYHPNAVILISAEHDHVNKFPTLKSYIDTYKKLVGLIPKNGILVYALNGKNNKSILKSAKCKHKSYGVHDKMADYYATNIIYGKVTSFDLMRMGKKIISLKTELLGKHNIENIVGAAAYLLETKKIKPEVFAEAIRHFHGIKRRIELINRGPIPVYEGFGSSYEKTRAIFDALEMHFPEKRIVAVFEPHAFSWRNKKFLPWYKDIFKGAGEVIMLPAASRGKKINGQLDTADIWREAKKHFPIHPVKNEKEALLLLKKIVRKDDVIVLISSGPMYGLPRSVPKLFK